MLDFAGDIRAFRFAWGDLEKLQEARGAGPYVILDRLVSGRWYVEDIADVIKFGLIGGGTEPAKAVKLVRDEVMSKAPLQSLVIAQQVLGSGVVGAPEEELEKKSEAASQEESPLSQTEGSDLPPSMEPEPS
nr:gene transfer agent family protein [Tianweitania sediminis]